jgi:hypothetical protein
MAARQVAVGGVRVVGIPHLPKPGSCGAPGRGRVARLRESGTQGLKPKVILKLYGTQSTRTSLRSELAQGRLQGTRQESRE